MIGADEYPISLTSTFESRWQYVDPFSGTSYDCDTLRSLDGSPAAF